MSGFFASLAAGFVQASRATQQAISELAAFPTEISCPNTECLKLLVVPESLWEWSCSYAHVNQGKDSICVQCGDKRPVLYYQTSALDCPHCQTKVAVPVSRASKHMATAVAQTKRAVQSTAKSAEDTYNELKSRPQEVLCACGDVVPVTAEAWESEEPTVFCKTCGVLCKVPPRVATIRLNQAAQSTKQAALSTKAATEEKIVHLKAAPSTFNCDKCNAHLHVPAARAWSCGQNECGTENLPEATKCISCDKANKVMVLCGNCDGVTVVPTNNLINSIRFAGLAAKQRLQAVQKAFNERQGPAAEKGPAVPPADTNQMEPDAHPEQEDEGVQPGEPGGAAVVGMEEVGEVFGADQGPEGQADVGKIEGETASVVEPFAYPEKVSERVVGEEEGERGEEEDDQVQKEDVEDLFSGLDMEQKTLTQAEKDRLMERTAINMDL